MPLAISARPFAKRKPMDEEAVSSEEEYLQVMVPKNQIENTFSRS